MTKREDPDDPRLRGSGRANLAGRKAVRAPRPTPTTPKGAVRAVPRRDVRSITPESYRGEPLFPRIEWAVLASSTAYMRWGKGPRLRLRFTKTGEAKLEALYGRHFVWPGKVRSPGCSPWRFEDMRKRWSSRRGFFDRWKRANKLGLGRW